jgi:hypothetical protein
MMPLAAYIGILATIFKRLWKLTSDRCQNATGLPFAAVPATRGDIW